jgi:ABC-type transporter MlaC component
VVAANSGFYKDLRALGFKTFHNVIDESFDEIEDNSQRLQMIAAEVQRLCASDLASFAEHTRETCIYNQQRFRELTATVKKQFPQQFQNYLSQFV